MDEAEVISCGIGLVRSWSDQVSEEKGLWLAMWNPWAAD